MLKTPRLLRSDPVLDVLTRVIGDGRETKVLSEGMIEIGHFSSDLLIYGRNGPWDVFEFNEVPVSGVCDSPAQFTDRFFEQLQADPRRLAVFFTHIRKEPGSQGGWRWHKWGEYIGDGAPTQEYLADEAGFTDGVYVFHVHDIDWKPEAVAR